MNRMKKEILTKNLIETWRIMIQRQRYLNMVYNEDVWLVSEMIHYIYPDVSRRYIRKVFWEYIYTDKEFIYKYEI